MFYTLVRTCSLLLFTFHLCEPRGYKYQVDYCDDSLSCTDSKTGRKKQHLLCVFKRETSIGGCTDIRGEMSPKERGRMLAVHNIYRDVFTQDDESYADYRGEWPNGSFFDWKDSPWAWRLNTWNKAAGLGIAICMRQFGWDYKNEKIAQIYAEQCTAERYDCMKDYSEEYSQFMSIFTKEGIHSGREAMNMAFDHWTKSKELMIKVPPNGAQDENYVANRLNDYDYTDANQSKYLDWANIMYWRSYMLGCGKVHFRQNGSDWTRVVCIYGPGVNHIPALKEKKAKDPRFEPESPSVLYTSDQNRFPCWYGNHPLALSIPPACPNFKCQCRHGLYDPLRDIDSSWPWLCSDTCLETARREAPIPSYSDFIRRSAVGKIQPLLVLLLGATSLSWKGESH